MRGLSTVLYGVLWTALTLLSAPWGWGGEAVDASSAERLVKLYPERVSALMASLDLERDGLKPVRKAQLQGSDAEALELLLNYFRSRPLDAKHFPELPHPREDILQLADDAVEGIFTIQSRTYAQPRTIEGGFDWDDPGPNRDKEWAWMMNRKHHFFFLITAYQSSGETRYLGTINDHLIDWILTHPVPDRLSFSTSWRPLEAARRITGSWLALFSYVRSNPSFSDEALFLMLSSIPEHVELLRAHYSFWGGNHKVTEKMAVVLSSVIWPEFRNSPSWLEDAMGVILQELFKQTYEDGAYKELANHYQKVVAENYLRLLAAVGREGVAALPDGFAERVELMWDFFALSSRPSGFGPLNNDSSLEDNFHFVRIANEYFEREDWDYIVSHGRIGRAPEGLPSRFFPWAGQAVMRSGWDEQAQWGFFEIGPHGTAHQHNDRLHLSVSFGSDELLDDTGRYSYLPGKMRDFFRGGTGHNVVRVNEGDSTRPPFEVATPMPVTALVKPEYDLFTARVHFDTPSLSQGRVSHTRSVLYVRHQGWLVLDHMLGYGMHRYDTYWNFHPACEVEEGLDQLNIVMASGRRAVLRHLLGHAGTWSLVRGQETPEVRGWYSWAYNERQPAVSARFRSHHNQPHINLWWIALHPDEGGPEIRLSDTEGFPRGEPLRILTPDRTLTLQLNQGAIEVIEVEN